MTKVIAAINLNHNGDADTARRLIDAARAAGADGVKLQKRTVGCAAVRGVLERPAVRWAGLGPSYRKALERVDLPAEVIASLRDAAGDLDFHLAPFDLEAFGQLQGIPAVTWKIESPLVVHDPLLEAVAAQIAPTVASVAGCTEAEIAAILVRLDGDATLMHSLCMSPFTGTVLDVLRLHALEVFRRPLGYADTSLDPALALTAAALGATIIEKPLTLDRSLPGPDHAQSLLPSEFAGLVARVRELDANAGTLRVPLLDEMDEIESDRPSIVAARAIPRGAKLTKEMLTLKPPAHGLSPRFLGFLLGRRVLYDIAEDDFLTFGMVEL
jgi:sialic acid synthase SpsE